jgi:hypothetical protein
MSKPATAGLTAFARHGGSDVEWSAIRWADKIMRDARYRAKFVAEMHDRMPVVLEAKDFEQERLATWRTLQCSEMAGFEARE